jgi:hypothetical protein
MTTPIPLIAKLITSLQAYPLYVGIHILKVNEFASDQFFFQLRARLVKNKRLMVDIYYHQGAIEYGFVLFGDDRPILRWDNKAEFPHIPTHPHHHHAVTGQIRPSPLVGEPEQDIQVVLQEVAVFMGMGE